ncbi:carbohydrate binding domain-containing protein [Metabacillus sp. cB07]|uniref:carbohydrate binding domain-containing protein n=1 Tax=Metabacillus sp. cB07 TaxID=2806989 RepID=UPI001939DD67|nr:carbohydrate binding domain-containing protein [Metabacillus sp. cB07]
MKKTAALMLSFFMAIGGSVVHADNGTEKKGQGENVKKPKWELVWADEFNTDEIDKSKWSFDIGNWIVDENGNGVAQGWGNNEKEYYTDSKENAYTKDGKLILKAKKEQTTDQFGTYDYTSAKVKTKGLFSHKYGRYEIKAKLPSGKGIWPALWMLPEEDKYGTWAASGEIDIMESWGSKPNLVAGTIHYGEGWPNNKYTGKDYEFKDGSTTEDWHTYALEWEPGELRWYVDGEHYQTQNKWYSKGTGNAANFSYPAPFDQNFYLIMNLAVGGWFDGDPDASTVFPKQMEIDYVRVFDLKNGKYKTPTEPADEPAVLPADAKQPLSDGNYIYDAAFEQPITDVDSGDDVFSRDYWNFVHLPDFGGQGAISVDQNLAKITVANPGSQLYSLQLIQNLSLAEAGTYKVSFDAKSDSARNIMVKTGAGAERGWVKYSNEEVFALTEELKSYSYTFKMGNETDILSRLEFNLGGNGTSPVWIGNVRVEDITGEPLDENASKPVLSNGNHVYNGTFDQGNMDRLTYWNLHTEGAKANVSVEEQTREAQLDIKNGGKTPDAIQFSQKGLQLLKGNEYTLTFKARAAKPRTIELNVTNQDGRIHYSQPTTIDLTTSKEEKTIIFTMTEDSDMEAQLLLNAGGSKEDVYFDDVVLLKTKDGNVDQNPLKNGDFSTGLAPWTSYIHYDATAGIAAENGEAKITVGNQGNEPWSVVLEQGDMKLSRNVTYEVSFKAKSTKPRELELTMENAQYTRFLSEKPALTGDIQTYAYEFVMPSDETAALKFLMGKTAGSPIGEHEIVIDDVVLKVKQ